MISVLALVGIIHSKFKGGFLNASLFYYLTLYSQAYQPGREVLVPFYSQHNPTEKHPWTKVRPHTQLSFPSHVSINLVAFLTHPLILMQHCFLGGVLRNPSTHHFTPSISCCWRSSEWRRNRLPLSGIMLWVTLSQLHTCRGNVMCVCMGGSSRLRCSFVSYRKMSQGSTWRIFSSIVPENPSHMPYYCMLMRIFYNLLFPSQLTGNT